MVVQVIDYNASTAPDFYFFDDQVRIPSGPFSLELAELEINIGDEELNRVELIATIGTETPELQHILYTIYRDGVKIFDTRQGTQNIETTTFQAIDFNLSPGKHVYNLKVEVLEDTSTSKVVGPLSFSALAIEVGPPSTKGSGRQI